MEARKFDAGERRIESVLRFTCFFASVSMNFMATHRKPRCVMSARRR